MLEDCRACSAVIVQIMKCWENEEYQVLGKYTGCYTENEIMFLLIPQRIKHLNSANMSYVYPDTIVTELFAKLQ